jgi:hypothetical protein
LNNSNRLGGLKLTARAKLLQLMLGVLLLSLMPQVGWTQNSSTLQITPFAGIRFGGTVDGYDEFGDARQVELDDSPSLGVIVNWPSVGPTEWEVYASHQSTDYAVTPAPGDTGKLELSYLQLGGTYLFEEAGPSQPYFVATAGLTHAKATNYGSDNYFSFAAGGGWKFFPAKRVGLRLDGRFIGTLISSNSAIFCQGSGGATCAVNVSGKVLWQFEMQAGVVFRF